MNHTCHAHGCDRTVPPRMLACKTHWFALRKDIRDAVWREYKEGQEVTKTPSLRYMAVQRFAVATLAFTPFNEEAARVSAEYLIEAQRWRIKAVQAGEGDPLEGLVPSNPQPGAST